MRDLYVVNCCRTAIGSFGGALKNTPAVDLGAIVIKEALNRAGVKPEQVDDAQALFLAKDIAKKIETELEYPGQIKVNVIREFRSVEYAK